MKTVFFICLFSSAFSFADTYPIVTLKNPFPGSAVYTTRNSDKKIAILKLHGSEGGSAYHGNIEASTLATQGYPAKNISHNFCFRVGIIIYKIHNIFSYHSF